MESWVDRALREYSILGSVSASVSLWINPYFSSSFNLSERGIEFMPMNASFWHFFQAIRDTPPIFFVSSIWLIIGRARDTSRLMYREVGWLGVGGI